MPFVSESQRRLMWAKHPEIARRWAREFPGQRGLPAHKRKRGGLTKALLRRR